MMPYKYFRERTNASQTCTNNAVSFFVSFRLQRSSVDLEQLQLNNSRLRNSIDLQQREMATMQERERQLKNKNKLLTTKLKAEKEEVRNEH